ncbi:hypothetical protein LEP1GSC116_0774 [Leptospira interrogans serovar Icterohaemorrhagiae str. Verdun HP]|uniref:Uncharacterized protein n=2 Tax=Leptospira interrogans TaxID=173 RepID=M6ZL38_LEPIR|nr:hypothetical protein LEP1GSC116_0774 [Leptospira interrogans serovar Icterohaemorrhagiae str. Verdun HP]EMP06826.1 hypothetical protein LEP1GSC124_3153 [Leptospira interrogans serovar Pyrogenes str. 200701872]
MFGDKSFCLKSIRIVEKFHSSDQQNWFNRSFHKTETR